MSPSARPMLPEPMVGGSPGIQALRRQLPKVAATRLTALITGESGTGKNVLARWIHRHGPRAAAPLVSVNCASLPRELLESELFGHEKGAFSGATREKPGRAELADGGTLFLDEIGDMPLDLQPKILTFLQDHAFFRVGGRRLLEVDVRVIAATNRNLAVMVQEGRFREDLFHRLNVLPLHLPPLRERQDEIPELALGFLRAALHEFGTELDVRLNMESLDLLLYHKWPGNIRELENAMYRAASLVGDDGEIRPEMLVPAIGPRQPDAQELSRAASASPAPNGGAGLPTLAEMEKRLLVEALRRFGGHKPSVAVALGISEKSVYNKMKHHGISL